MKPCARRSERRDAVDLFFVKEVVVALPPLTRLAFHCRSRSSLIISHPPLSVFDHTNKEQSLSCGNFFWVFVFSILAIPRVNQNCARLSSFRFFFFLSVSTRTTRTEAFFFYRFLRFDLSVGVFRFDRASKASYIILSRLDLKLHVGEQRRFMSTLPCDDSARGETNLLRSSKKRTSHPVRTHNVRSSERRPNLGPSRRRGLCSYRVLEWGRRTLSRAGGRVRG